MSKIEPRQLLLRHAIPFALSFTTLTMLLLAERWGPRLSATGAPGGTTFEVLLLALPSTVALTIPMSVFLAVSWVFMRLGAEGVLASARRERGGILRLLTPVLGVATVLAALALVSNTVVLPRANARLVEVLDGAPRGPTERTMTMGELRAAADRARTETGARLPPSVYEVEIQKKYAIAAGCVTLAMAAAAIAFRFPRYGARLVLAASPLVFIGYWLLMIAGEMLADEQLLSPLVAMWMANAVFLGGALLLVRPSGSGPTNGAETLAING